MYSKRYLSAVLLIIFLVTISSPVYAADLVGDGIITEDEKDAITNDQGGMFERIMTSPITAIVLVFQKLEEEAAFQTFDKLIFNHGLSDAEKELAPFNSEEWGKLNVWYAGMAAICGGFALINVIITAYKFLYAGAINPRARQTAMENMWRWLGAIMIIAGAPALFYVVFNLNNAMVDSLQAIAAKVGADAGELEKLSLSEDDGSIISNITTGSVLGTALVKLLFCGIEAWLNIIYIMRHFILIGIYIFTPIMAWMWAINKNVNAMPVWVGELLSNGFMQTAHALCLLIFLTFCNIDTNNGSWFFLLVWMATIIPLAEMFRNSVQGVFTRMAGMDEAGNASKVLGAMGFASAMGAGNLVKTAMPVNTPSLNTQTPGPGGGSPSGNMMPPSAPTGVAAQTQAMPQGYTQTPSGLAVPNAAQGGGNQIGNTGTSPVGNVSNMASQGQGGQQPNTAPGLGMVRAANMARTSAGVAGAVAGAGAGLMFSLVPGGEKVAGTVARGVSGLTATTVTAGGVGAETLKQYKSNKEQQPDYSMGQAFKDVTGSQSNLRGAAKTAGIAATEGISPTFNSPQIANTSLNAAVPSIDGMRWR
ncbi:MAG: hypothetical protein FH758_04065 [Firmicutes bacterium]|nr:hypothetical protein [Bacillota bacterium]